MKNLLNKYIKLATAFLLAILLQNHPVFADDEVIVKDISQISLDEIGLLNDKNGGLPSDIWNDSDRPFMETMLAALPLEITSPVGQDLRSLLLLSSATPPVIRNAPLSSIFNVRIKLLAKTGEYEDLTKLLEKIPDDHVTEQIDRVRTAAYFLSENYDEACTKTDIYQKKYKATFWRQANIICNAYNKKDSVVDFNIKLLADDGYKLAPEDKKAVNSFLSGKQKEGMSQWRGILNKTVLALPNIISTFPSLQKVETSKFDHDKIQKWFDGNKDISITDKLIKAVELYANIDATGTQITKHDWQQFVMFSITNDIPIPTYATFKLLNISQSKGEKILLVLHALNKRDAKNIPQYLFTQMLASLHDIGLEKEATQLAEEGMFNE